MEIWIQCAINNDRYHGFLLNIDKIFLGTVLDPLKESTEKRIKGSPYIFQWFNNKALTYRFLIYMIPNVDLIQKVPSIYLKQGM